MSRKVRKEGKVCKVVRFIVLLFALTPLSVAAQVTPPVKPPVRPAREVIFDKLRTMGREPVRDTTGADSLKLDSLRREAQGQPPRRARQQPQAPTDIQSDSIMRALMQLPDFNVTQYQALSARAHSDSLILVASKERKAVVVQAGQSMTADSLLTFDQRTAWACGYGKPVLTGATSEEPVQSERVCYNTRAQVGVAMGASTKFTQGAAWNMTADLYTRGTDVFGHDAVFTDCNLEEPHYHFQAREVKVVNGDVMVARNVTLQFGDVPVFWLPFMMQSMKQGRRSGILMPRFSINDIVRRNTRYNRRIENVGFYWATNENMGAQLTLDWFANNWTAVNGGLDYKFNEQFLDGRVSYRHFFQTEGGTQFTLAANNSWQPSERTSLRADLQYSTSSSFIRNSSYDPRELNRSIDSNAGMSRRFDWGSLSLQASRRQHLSDNKVDMTLPSLGLNLSQVTFFEAAGAPRWYNNATWTGSAQARFTSAAVDQVLQPRIGDSRDMSASANSSISIGSFSWSQSFDMREATTKALGASGDTVAAVPEVKQRRMNLNTGVNFQQRLVGTSTFTPGISLRSEFAQDSLGKTISAPMRLDLNAALRVDLFGFWPGVGPLERIRHKLSPNFSYSYSPATRPDSAQRKVFGATPGREQNRISIGLSQTIEGKLPERTPEGADTTAAAVDTTASMDPDNPRRRQQSRPVTLLALNTDAVVYDFVEARDGLGVQTTQISNSINSDLLRGLQLSITHDLFETAQPAPGQTPEPGTAPDRKFKPHLSRVNASFSLSGSSWLFQWLGGKGSDTPPATGSTPTPVPEQADAGVPTDPSRPELGLMGTRNRVDSQMRQPRGAIGSWNASLNFTMFRPRKVEGIASDENQMVTGNFNFQPTEMWSVAWNTGYSFTDKAFTDHILTLTRAMHDWDANFDFVKAQNGNFSFQFRVQLRANPDIKFDYQQRDNTTPRVPF